MDISFEKILSEAYRKNDGGYGVTIIEAGEHEGKYYPPSTLQKASHLFENLQAFVDRPTPREKRERAERSIRDLAGIYKSVHVEGEKLKGTLHLVEGTDWLEEIIEKCPQALGIKINADGRTRRQFTNGKTMEVVESINDVFSADLITSTIPSMSTGKLSESRKEKKMSSEPYYIGTILPEAKRAWFTLQELMEGRSPETNTEAQEKEIGSILPEARRAYRELISNG